METFKHYWASLTPKEKRQLAADSDTDYTYLSKLASGKKQAGPMLIQRLCLARPAITVGMLRPELARAMAVQAGG